MACNPGDNNLNLADCLFLNETQTVQEVYSTPSALINTIVPNLFVIGGIIVFGLIVYSGFKFVSEGAKGKDEAKRIMTTAITGLVIMFVAYWIVQIVGTITGVGNLGI